MNVKKIRLAKTLAYHCTVYCTVYCTGAAFITSTPVSAHPQHRQVQQSRAAQSLAPTQGAQGRRVLIVTANIDYSDGDVKRITVTGKSKVRIKKVADIREAEEIDATERRDGDARYTVQLDTSNFSDQEYEHRISKPTGEQPEQPEQPRNAGLVIKIGDKLFIPNSYGGPKEGVNNGIELRNVDRVSAETLCGYKLSPAPKNCLSVAFQPPKEAYLLEDLKAESNRATGADTVKIHVTNQGKIPLKFHWGTTAGQNPPARDTQLFFTATREEGTAREKVSPNPKPLGDGYIMSSLQLAPQSVLHHSAMLTQWLAFDKPGTYQVAATYKIFILNPKEGAFPSQWTVIYRDTFPIQIKQNNP